VRASGMVIAVENGHTAVVSAAPELGGRFRFLADFNSAGQPYTLAEGAPGLTLAGCAAGPAGTNGSGPVGMTGAGRPDGETAEPAARG